MASAPSARWSTTMVAPASWRSRASIRRSIGWVPPVLPIVAASGSASPPTLRDTAVIARVEVPVTISSATSPRGRLSCPSSRSSAPRPAAASSPSPKRSSQARVWASSGRRQRSRNSREALAEPRNSASSGPSRSSPSSRATPASPPSVSSGEPGRPVRMSAAVTSVRWDPRAAVSRAPMPERAAPPKSSAGTDSSSRSAAWMTPALDFSR